MAMKKHPRWAMGWTSWKGPTGVAQTSNIRRNHPESIRLPEPILRLAQEEYDRQFPGQPYERMQERGGLSVTEIITFLADLIERDRGTGPWAEPTTSVPPATPVSESPQGQL